MTTTVTQEQSDLDARTFTRVVLKIIGVLHALSGLGCIGLAIAFAIEIHWHWIFFGLSAIVPFIITAVLFTIVGYLEAVDSLIEDSLKFKEKLKELEEKVEAKK